MPRIVTAAVLAIVLAVLAAAPAAAAPANDNFADATVVSGGLIYGPDTNAGATLEPGEPDALGAAPPVGGATVWYVITPPDTGSYTFDVCQTSVDVVLALYTGSDVTTASRVGVGADGGCPGNDNIAASLTKRLTAGVTYHLQVGGYASPRPATGSFGLQVRESLNVPANDAFAGATVLTGPTPTAPFNTKDASDELGEPDHLGLNPTVWFSWTAPVAGPRLLSCVDDAGNGVTAGVYTGAAVSALTKVVESMCDDVPFVATAGVTYRFSVATPLGSTGSLAVEAGGLVGPATTDLGAVPVGKLGPAVTLTFNNTSTHAVEVSGASTRGASSADVLVLRDGTCIDGSVAAGASCTVRVRLAPTAEGARSASVRLDGRYGSTDDLEVSSAPVTGSGTSRTGAVGPAGPAGTGAAGPTGPAGSAGGPGAQGAAGPAGPIGPAGAAGPGGVAGQQGTSGAPGPTGLTGAAGTLGSQGPAGPPGTVTCRTSKPKGKPGKKLRVRCVIAGARAGTARIVRGGRVVRTVAARHGLLRVGRLSRGRYVVVLRTHGRLVRTNLRVG